MTDSQFLGDLLYRAYMADVISIGEVKDACERIGITYPPNLVQNEMFTNGYPLASQTAVFN